ncbi:MAG: hypothetical protein ACLFP1_07930 [Candidatus Goldiibacteriota bacterium]
MGKKKNKEKKIDMSYHEYKMRSLGLSQRARKLMIRLLLLSVPVIFIAFIIVKNHG